MSSRSLTRLCWMAMVSCSVFASRLSFVNEVSHSMQSPSLDQSYVCDEASQGESWRSYNPSTDNSFGACATRCEEDETCAGFDFTTSVKQDACRLYHPNIPRTGSAGWDQRRYCTKTHLQGNGLTVGILTNHDPDAWSNPSCGKQATLPFIHCNLRVHEQAIATAASEGVSLLVFPEGYSLAGAPSAGSFFEPMISEVGKSPCFDADVDAAPQQKLLSCAARNHGVAVAANMFVELENRSRRIVEVVFDKMGDVQSVYHKNHMAPIVEGIFEPGPFSPTTFDLLGRRWGVIICAEGVYPSLPWGNYEQMEELARQQASVFIWAVGAMVPIQSRTEAFTRRFNVSMISAMLSSAGSIVGAQGVNLVSLERRLSDLEQFGYTGKASLRFAKI